ncbi:MAG: hypothetical protein ACO24D_17775 [bacterium]
MSRRFGEYFKVYRQVCGQSFYRDVFRDVRIDVLLIDEQRELAFGIECKKTLHKAKEVREVVDQQISYLNSRWSLPRERRVFCLDAVFLASPGFHSRFDDTAKAMALKILPSSLGVADFQSEVIELRLCTGTRVWSSRYGYHQQVNDLLRIHVGSQRMNRTHWDH